MAALLRRGDELRAMGAECVTDDDHEMECRHKHTPGGQTFRAFHIKKSHFNTSGAKKKNYGCEIISKRRKSCRRLY